MARSFGKATSEFEKARILAKKEVDKLHDADRVTREKLESIADTLKIDYDGKDDESLKKDIDAAIKRDKEYDVRMFRFNVRMPSELPSGYSGIRN